MNHTCLICGGKRHYVHHRGQIRIGRFGHLSASDIEALRCEECLVVGIPDLLGDQAAFYATDAYRKSVDATSEAHGFFQLHDAEQAVPLAIIGTGLFRDRTVADIGCGAGSFLDFIRGAASQTIAIEPSATFRESLAKRGYPAYSYVSDALPDHAAKIDMAVSFSVLEHVADPLRFLKEIHALLGPQGTIALSTPNADDILLSTLPGDYPQFFYRQAHLWYFNPASLTNLLRHAGFHGISVMPHHRFGLGNYITWVRERRPAGDIRLEGITPAMDSVWKSELERTLRCDYLFATARANPAT